MLQIFQVIIDRLRHGVATIVLEIAVDTGVILHAKAGLVDGLPETQDRRAIRVGEIIRGADAVFLVTLVSDVASDDPRPCRALMAAVAEMHALLN